MIFYRIDIVSISYRYCINIVSIDITRPWRGGRTERREGIQEGKKKWKEGRKRGRMGRRKEGGEEGIKHVV